MSEELLQYYDRELHAVRELFREFAAKHPETAAALQIADVSIGDPHVKQLIMAFAYLTARIQCKLHDDFPEITDALLGVLYPHFLAPIPSMAIAQFALADSPQAVKGHTIPVHAVVETQKLPIPGMRTGEACTYRTGYPVSLWPLKVTSASLTRRPFAWAKAPPQANAVVQVKLESTASEVPFGKLELERLRFFLHGDSQHDFGLYEILLNNVVGVTLANTVGRDTTPVVLPMGAVLPVGFRPEEGLLPVSPGAFPGYRLLSEYFAFPEKFCFVDLVGITEVVRRNLGKCVELSLYLALNQPNPDLENKVTQRTFQLGCTPIVNLFPRDAEPISITQTRTEYPVVAERGKAPAREIYSIDRVSASLSGGVAVECQPFYSFRHTQTADRPTVFWHAVRRAAPQAMDRDRRERVDHGTHMSISLVDLDFQATSPERWTLHPRVTCFNRDLPSRIPFVASSTLLSLVDPPSPLVSKEHTICLTRPTPTLRPLQGDGARWRLISHLLLNHLSIVGGEGGSTDAGAVSSSGGSAGREDPTEAFREVLRLYSLGESPVTTAKIAGVLGMTSRRVVARSAASALGSLCRGLEVTLHLDEGAFADGTAFLFGSVVERFLAWYSTINSFTQLKLTTNRRPEPVKLWPPRAGQKILI